MPLNVIEPLPLSSSQPTSQIVSSGQQAPTPSVKDSRKGKDVIDNLTIEVESVALYQGITLKRLNHHVDQLSYMVHERQLNPMCEGVDVGVMLNRLRYHTSVSLTLFLI